MPAVVGRLPGPPPWSTCCHEYNHDDDDDDDDDDDYDDYNEYEYDDGLPGPPPCQGVLGQTLMMILMVKQTFTFQFLCSF